MEKNFNLLESTLNEEGLIPEVFNKKIFTNNFLIKLQKGSVYESWKQISSKMASIVTKSIKDLHADKAIQELKQLVSSVYIDWNITSLDPKNTNVARVMALTTSGMSLEQIYELKYKESNKPIITAVASKSFKRHTGSYTVRSTGEPFRFEDLGETLGRILLFNGLLEFVTKNTKRSEYVFLKTLSTVSNLSGYQLRGSSKVQSYIDSLNDKYKEHILPVQIVSIDAEKVTPSLVVSDACLKNFGICSEDFISDRFPMSALNIIFLNNLLLDMHQLSESIISFVNNSEEVERTYAASYELKKNIPDSTLAKMNSTYLNELFSEIEIDEAMDLADFEAVEVEYAKYAHMFPTVKTPSLRFRRLGKHKASGIYFAYQKAICVDIRYTTSMIHELSHWLDYNYRALLDPKCTTVGYRSLLSSTDVEFWQISKKYIAVLDKYVDSLPEASPIRMKYYGTTKYNRRYYTDNAEIFARLSEMYFESKFGKSILWQTEDFAYPKDDELLRLATKFFDRIFDSLKNISPKLSLVDTPVEECLEKVASHQKSTPIIENKEVAFSFDGNQLCLF